MKRLTGYVLALFFLISCVCTTTAYADVTTLNKKATPPEIVAEAGVVIEASSGTVLYNKNMDEKMYPASITKILTTLLALENSSLTEQVTYSHYSVFSLEPGAANVAMDEGEIISMKDTLNAVMLASANECANAAGEHVAKKTDAYSKKIAKLSSSGKTYDESEVAISVFADMMNQRAKQAGAKNSHFKNPNGLFDKDHYTTCYDMAMIMREAIKNEAFLKLESNYSYTIGKTNKMSEERPFTNRHAMMNPYKPEYDETIIAGKTGYVDQSGNTLVTVSKHEDMTLISVVMKTDTYNVYSDTKAILDYGFNNYEAVNVSNEENRFSLAGDDFFTSIGTIFTDDKPLLEVDDTKSVVLPKGVSFDKLKSEISLDKSLLDNEDDIAIIKYYYGKQQVGYTTLNVSKQDNTDGFNFGPSKPVDKETAKSSNKKIRVDLRIVLAAVIAIVIIFLLVKYERKLRLQGNSRRKIRKERYGRRGYRRTSSRRRKRPDTYNVHHRHRHKR